MEKTYLTLNEASIFLRSSKSKLYKMTMMGTIPHRKFGRIILFIPSELTEFIEKGKTIEPCSRRVNELELITLPSLAA
jgi:excisionase family DNA binding protein